MDHNAIERLERNLKAMGARPIGADEEHIIWQLPNGMRWPVEKRDNSIVLSDLQKKGVEPAPVKQIIVRPTPSPIVERPLTPTLPDRVVVVDKPEEYLVRRVEATSSHYLNRTVPGAMRKRGRAKGQEQKVKADMGHSLSRGFIEEANKIFQEKGRAAAQEFIRKKKDLWSAR